MKCANFILGWKSNIVVDLQYLNLGLNDIEHLLFSGKYDVVRAKKIELYAYYYNNLPDYAYMFVRNGYKQVYIQCCYNREKTLLVDVRSGGSSDHNSQTNCDCQCHSNKPAMYIH